MEELINQALLELAGEEGYRGNVQRLLEGHGEANIASDLAAKLLAKGVKLPIPVIVKPMPPKPTTKELEQSMDYAREMGDTFMLNLLQRIKQDLYPQ